MPLGISSVGTNHSPPEGAQRGSTMNERIKKDIEEMNTKGMAFDAIVSALFDKHGMTEQATMFIMLNSNLIKNRS